jgi:ABC-type branched-subunit amino acid transport system substrate-binding protein
MTQYSNQQFDSALLSFVRVHQMYSLNQRTTAASIMMAKSLNRLQRFSDAYALSREFIWMYPLSVYKEDAHYDAAFAAEEMGHLSDAIREAATVVNGGRERKNVDNARLLLGQISKTWGADSIARSIAAVSDPNVQQCARDFFSELSDRKSVGIGVLLPLLRGRTDRAQIRILAQELLEGMTVAIDEYNRSPRRQGVQLTLDVRDTGGDSLLAATQARSVAQEQKNIAIVGPLFSAEARAVAAVATAEKIPVLSPTATDNGIAALSPFLFQSNPDYETRGRALASYAMEVMGYTRMAIFAPKTAEALRVSEAFRAEVEKRGGEIVSEFRYPLNTTDVRHLFRAVITDAITKAKAAQTTDSSSVFSQYLQAIFCPIDDAAEIGIITPQMRYYNIQSQILGTSEWYDLSELEMNKLYADGVIFCSDRWIADPGAAAEFRTRFQQSTGHAPGTNALLGYDVMRFIIESIVRGASSRERLAGQLLRMEGFEGIQTKIAFTAWRVNAALQIIQYKKGKLSRIGEMPLH